MLCALGIAALHPGERGRIGPAIEGRLLDLRFAMRGPLPAPESVAVVAFDDRAMVEIAFPPARMDIAKAIEGIFAAGARAVAVDMLLVDARPEDSGLAQAMRRGPVVLGVAEAPAGSVPPALDDPAGFALLTGFRTADPLPALAPAPGLQGQAALGHVTVHHDLDGALRRIYPARALGTDKGAIVLPSLAVAATSAGGPGPRLTLSPSGTDGQLAGPWPTALLDLRGALPLSFYGPGGTILTHSVAGLEGADLTNRVVFLGATATGFGDRHAATFDATMPGVELHATLAANLLEGRVLRRDAVAFAITAGMAVIAALAGLACAGRSGPIFAVLSSICTTGLTLVGLQFAFAHGWWLDALSVLAALLIGLSTGASVRFLDHRQRASNLARYQSPRFVEAIAAQADPFGRNAPQMAIVLFVDIADFTARAEHLGPSRTATFLRAFHQHVEAAAEPRGGAIMDFAGDGVLVVFGVPVEDPSDAMQSIGFIEDIFARTRAEGIVLRASGHAGPVTLGLLGGARQRRISVSGDVVNTASRLQEIAKQHHAHIALSGAVIARAPQARLWAERARLTCLPDQVLRGRQKTETVWVGSPAQAVE